jgi:hypothetical protein
MFDIIAILSDRKTYSRPTNLIEIKMQSNMSETLYDISLMMEAQRVAEVLE